MRDPDTPHKSPLFPRPSSSTNNGGLSPHSPYTQPLGTGGGSQRHRGRQRSNTVGSSPSLSGTPVMVSSEGVGRVRRVYCDLVLEMDQMTEDDEGCLRLPRPIHDFLNSVGSPIDLNPRQGAGGRPTSPIKPGTPGKTPSPNLNRAINTLRELAMTEVSYYRKLHTFYHNFAEPLRRYARSSTTTIIKAYEATTLFSNLAELVPITERFATEMQALLRELEREPIVVPRWVGECVLRNVEQMRPYKKFLSNTSFAQSLHQQLYKNKPEFKAFIDATLTHSRETANYTGGFSEFLAEPFQRMSKYQLLFLQIRDALPQDDPTSPYLTEAANIMHEVCSLEVDDNTRQAAAMWSLKRTIAGFPDALVSYDRQFITCLDCNETFTSSDSTPVTLRCTLFLFSDKLVIAKRPSGDKSGGGQKLVGLDNMDKLALVYRSDVAGTTVPGTPRKLKKDSMGFRGAVDLDQVFGVDFGDDGFGLVFERPPVGGQSDRWLGRPARRYTVAHTYPTDVRRPEKDVFLNHLAERKCLFSALRGGGMARKSRKVWDGVGGGAGAGAAGGSGDSFVIYFNFWERALWERDVGKRRGWLAVQLDGTPGEAMDLDFNAGIAPKVIARADFVTDDECFFSVRSADRPSRPASERIKVERIPKAIDTIASSHHLYDYPMDVPRTPGGSLRPRPRSFVLSTALDVFGGAGLKRGESTTSKTSTATTTSRFSVSSGAFSPQPSRATSQNQRQPMRSPGMYSSIGSSKSVAELRRSTNGDESFASETEDEDSLEVLNSRMQAGSTSSRLAPPGRSRRRSSSMPLPPPASLLSPSPPRPQPQQPHSAEASVSFDHVESEGAGQYTSPLNYRPTLSRGPRLMGPRQPGEQPRARTPSGSVSPRPQTPVVMDYRREEEPSSTDNSFSHDHTPSRSPPPFAQDHSPSPVKPTVSTSASTATVTTLPLDSSASTGSSSPPGGTKRNLADMASPRQSPAKKKVATLNDDDDAGPRKPSSPALSSKPFAGQVRIPSGSRRSASGQRTASGGAGKRRNFRVPSSSSALTIRPPDDPPEVPPKDTVSPTRNSVVPMDEDTELPYASPAIHGAEPFDRLREHILDLRLKLSKQQSSGLSPEKENSPVGAGLSRSPNTRNVFLKANTLSSFIPSPSNALDTTAMLRWADRLDSLLEDAALDSATQAEAGNDSLVSQDTEIEMLMAERSLLADEMEEMRAAVKARDAEIERLKQELEESNGRVHSTHEQNETLRTLYNDMCGSIRNAYSDYAEELNNLAILLKENSSPEVPALVDRLEEALLQKHTSQLDYAQLERDVALAAQEKEEWRRILQAHGLLA
ncbi:hypothetical protein T439DRAFT_353150 [Meredithblackwellia eburnea MCA 4105]